MASLKRQHSARTELLFLVEDSCFDSGEAQGIGGDISTVIVYSSFLFTHFDILRLAKKQAGSFYSLFNIDVAVSDHNSLPQGHPSMEFEILFDTS